ncbi:MAG: hypothetical protein WCG81_07260 [Candidatus Angelobacter sp.]
MPSLRVRSMNNRDTEFSPNWHIEVIAAELEACWRGETKRLIINVPPRSLKSQAASVAFPAWLMGHNPSAQIICASYGQDLANKHAGDCRSVLSSDFYRSIVPTRLSPDRKAVHELMTTEKGVRLATSIGGFFGSRADIAADTDSGQGSLGRGFPRGGSRTVAESEGRS